MKEKSVRDAKEKCASLFSWSPETSEDSSLKISFFFSVIEFLDFLLLWKMKQMSEGCGLFTLAEWVSRVCKRQCSSLMRSTFPFRHRRRGKRYSSWLKVAGDFSGVRIYIIVAHKEPLSSTQHSPSVAKNKFSTVMKKFWAMPKCYLLPFNSVHHLEDSSFLALLIEIQYFSYCKHQP